MSDARRLMRCDLHVHSRHSGPSTIPVLGRLVRECYSDPEAVYEAARWRGMDFVTLTDHDSIAGSLELAGRPDTFVSEEVTCLTPDGRELHLGLFDITERQHEEIQARRRDLEALLAYAAEQGLPACVNHPFSSLTGRRSDRDLTLAFAAATHVETRNGMMSERVNAHARSAGRRARLAATGGSDAHTLFSVGRAFTCVDAADRAEFLAGLRAGRTVPAGRSGSYARLTADLARLAAFACRDQAWRAQDGDPAEIVRLAAVVALLPLLPLLPIVTAAVYADEQLFAWRHSRRFERERSRSRAGRPPLLGAPAPGATTS
jgi:predicted metal-dependent phosphoesterase TrpH